MGELRLDPLVLVARAQDLILHARVLDYPTDGWATLTHERRQFFDWGGWLAIRNGLWLENEDATLAADAAFADALAGGMQRLLALLEIGRIDVGAVAQRALRKRLASAAKR